MSDKPHIVILAGGKGTRLKSVSGDIPKPMVLIKEKPVLEYLVKMCVDQGFSTIHFLIGYKADIIENHFGDGNQWSAEFFHHKEEIPLGTAGAVKSIQDQLSNQFILIYGDVFSDIDLISLYHFHNQRHGLATLTVHPNRHPKDSDLIELNEENEITAFHSKPHPENTYFHNQVNAGICIFEKEILNLIPENEFSDFGKDILPKLIGKKKLLGYPTIEYMRDMGTPDRLAQVQRDVVRGKPEKMRRIHKKQAVFLDRDGVINRFVPLLSRVEDFQLRDGTADAISRLNDSDLLAVVVTNQPQVARGILTFEQLQSIHKKMEWNLGLEGARLDGIYYCPHHPDAGYEGEVKELKVKCDCRKPSSGMFRRASEDLGIDLRSSVMVGDSYRDIQAGKKLGMKTALLLGGETGPEKATELEADFVSDQLTEIVNWILLEES